MDSQTPMQLAAIVRERFDAGGLAEAIGLLRQAVAAARAEAGFLADLGFACRRAGWLDEAHDALQRAVALDPRYVDAWVHLADVLTDLGRIEPAAEAYFRVISLRPDDPGIYARIGGATKDPSQIDAVLSNIGLAELAVGTPEEYLETASALAADFPRLTALRGGLRDRLRRSPLMDGPRFACDLQDAYRSLWRQWCGSQQME